MDQQELGDGACRWILKAPDQEGQNISLPMGEYLKIGVLSSILGHNILVRIPRTVPNTCQVLET
jgi:hypothetical protein